MEHRSSSEGSLASSIIDDIEGKSNNELLDELARDYSKYLNFDISREQVKFTESIESMLTKLDEFCGLVDLIRSDTSLCLTKTLPQIQTRCQEMQEMFDRIDRLEAFVAIVKKDVSTMEECVSKAENELSSGNLIKKLSLLVSSKKSSNKPAQKPQFTPPHIFHTERFLGSSCADSSNIAASTSSIASASSATPAVNSSSSVVVSAPSETEATKAESAAT